MKFLEEYLEYRSQLKHLKYFRSVLEEERLRLSNHKDQQMNICDNIIEIDQKILDLKFTYKRRKKNERY